ncbi:MAG: ATP synthase F0 subunit C [Deltaproteobacteria bacterium]|nr:ATP synthase F0 subunit C [Deltaproteobacteria bacterium]
MRKFVVSLLSFVSMMLLAAPAFAQDGGTWTAGAGLVMLGAGLGIGIAAFGGAIGQGLTASAAVGGIARNPQSAPKVQTPMIIALAMTESLVLFAFVITFFIQGKI